MSETVTVSLAKELQVPRVPNYLLAAGGPDGEKVSIAALSEDELEAVASAWGRKLLARAEQLRNLPREDQVSPRTMTEEFERKGGA